MAAKLYELSEDIMRERTPAIFTERRNPNMSDRYVHVPTIRVIEQLREHGFVPTRAVQDTPNQRDPKYVRHEVRLTHKSKMGSKVGDTIPQIILENSGNGRTMFRGKGGLYRLVCENGMMTGESFETFEFIHMYDFAAEIQRMVGELGGQLDRAMDQIGIWKVTELSKFKQTNFAKKALEIRFGKDGAKAYDPKLVLEAKRDADAGADLWHVFNRVQENIIRGGFQGESANGRVLGVRELKGITSQRDINAQLWDAAEKLAA